MSDSAVGGEQAPIFLTIPQSLLEMTPWMMLIIAVAVILAVPVIVDAAYRAQPAAERVSSSLGTVLDGVEEICKVDEAIYDRVESAFGNDPKVREILEQRELGQIWPECGLGHLYKYLGEENRKRIGWLELACDVSHCTQELGLEPKQ